MFPHLVQTIPNGLIGEEGQERLLLESARAGFTQVNEGFVMRMRRVSRMSGTVRMGMLGVALVVALLAGVGVAALVRAEPTSTNAVR